MDILEKISEYRLERGWSEYQLAEKSGLTQSTISSWYRKNMLPSITSLERICDAFNITLSQFFADEKEPYTQLTHAQKEIIDEYNKLERRQQQAFLDLLKSFR